MDSGDVLHPYELLKNPFKDKGELVTLNVLPFPIFADGVLAEYQSIDPELAKRVGRKGLRFNRMISDKVCLFDILGVNPMESGDLDMLGQIAVQISPDQPVPPDDTRTWNIEPLGTIEGTNGYGAQIEIPYIRFLNYGRDSQRVDGNAPSLSGDSLRAVNLVRDHIKPAANFLALNPDFMGAKWDALYNPNLCAGCWFVSEHIRIHSDSSSPMQYFENPGWEVDLSTNSVKPNPDAVKFYQSAHAKP